jgi:hypothetical protein
VINANSSLNELWAGDTRHVISPQFIHHRLLTARPGARQRISGIDAVLHDTIKCGLGDKAFNEFWDNPYPDTLITQGAGTLDSYATNTK